MSDLGLEARVEQLESLFDKHETRISAIEARFAKEMTLLVGLIRDVRSEQNRIGESLSRTQEGIQEAIKTVKTISQQKEE